MTTKPPVKQLKPIYIYDHLPDILCGYPTMAFLLLAAASMESVRNFTGLALSKDALFWVGLVVALAWFIAFRYNLPKARFWLVFGLLGTFVGIPVILELTGYIAPFQWLGTKLGALAPEVSTGVWLVGAMVFGVAWICALVWSRTHMCARLDETGLTIKRIGGRGERFDLIGLKTEDEPIDYLERFMAGIGSLSLKTRMNKPIFTMKRVIGLYWSPLTPWRKGKLAKIEEMLSYQGKVLSVGSAERIELAEAADSMEDGETLFSEDNPGEMDMVPNSNKAEDDTNSPDIG